MPAASVEHTSETIFQGVKEILVEALGLDDGEVVLDARIPADLGAASIDFLDINFRLERHFQAKLPRAELFPRVGGQDNSDDILTTEVMQSIQEALHFETSFAHVTPNQSTIGDFFTVRVLCQALAHKFNVPWQDPS